jgi:SAM-dependent methyltransferase
MHNILWKLNSAQIVVDLGCGGGSFNYSTYPCKIVGIDVGFGGHQLYADESRVLYLQSNAGELPLMTGSVDAFICNHTFEHFANYKQALREINRVLNPSGMLWIAVPDGYSFDDFLYRSLFAGGGHLNRFTYQRLVDEVQSETDLGLVQAISLFSGFVYLKRPTTQQFKDLPPFGKFLYYVPDQLGKAGISTINVASRLVDKLFGSRISQYGWGFVFARGKVELYPLPSYFNVCWKCGAGNGAQELRSSGSIGTRFGVSLFSCMNCRAKSVFFEPPRGLS